jgi:hypothetical protein
MMMPVRRGCSFSGRLAALPLAGSAVTLAGPAAAINALS